MMNNIDLINQIQLNQCKIDADVDNWIKQKEFRTYKDYARSGFEKINMALRSGFCIDTSTIISIGDLDKLFQTLPAKLKNKKPIEVYRGIPFNYGIDRFFQNNPLRKIFTNKAFVSTSKSKYVAENFKMEKDGFLFHIIIPKNSCVIDNAILPSSAQSHMRTEQEVLLPRNAQFIVLSYSPKTRVATMKYIGQKLPLELPEYISKVEKSDILSIYNKAFIKENINPIEKPFGKI